ncbi:MAG TPA: DUF1697 domain-containing protein [Woeseiaceae bacterium]|nr:DUF1697 domain-containing protein [Woeseiaceae bacterium]
MPTCILFFRGINVGGRNRLPMDQVVGMLNSIGMPGAVTYIQSGNVAVRCSRQQANSLGRRLKEVMHERLDFEPGLLVLKIQEIEHAIAANPFREAARDPETLHLWFLAAEPADPDLEGLEGLKTPSERFVLDKKVFYLHAPEGIGQSRLASSVEKCLGVEATARNWRTVTKTLEMAWQLS